MAKRKRREYSKQFKADAVKLVKKGDKSSFRVAQDLDITPSALRNWIKRAEIDAGQGPEGALSTAEREELKRLRKENKQLMMEREILKKRRPSLPRKARKIRVCQGTSKRVSGDDYVQSTDGIEQRI